MPAFKSYGKLFAVFMLAAASFLLIYTKTCFSGKSEVSSVQVLRVRPYGQVSSVLHFPNTKHHNISVKPVAESKDIDESVFKSDCQHRTRQERASLPACSLEIFNEFFRKKHQFPECGQWVDQQVGFGYTEHYELDFCSWQPLNAPECFLRKGISRIFMTGDSTGFRLFLATLNFTIRAGGQCELQDYEHGPINLQGNATYYAQRMSRSEAAEAFVMHQRGCKWCKAQRYVCQIRNHQGVSELELDFMETYHFNDDSMKMGPESAAKHNFSAFSNVQEFFFKDYFPKAGSPDLMIMSMPLNHEKWQQRPDTIRRFKNMMTFLEQQKSSGFDFPLMMIPTAAEFKGKRITASYGPTTFGGKTAAEFIYKLNVELYPLLEPYLMKPELNLHSYVNLVNMSITKSDWNEDGVHYNYIWYNHLITGILSTFCA